MQHEIKVIVICCNPWIRHSFRMQHGNHEIIVSTHCVQGLLGSNLVWL